MKIPTTTKGRSGLGLAVGLVVLLLVGYLVRNGVISDGNSRENRLNAQYVDNQNYLSDCIIRGSQAAQVAGAKTDAVDRVLTDAVKGRYDTPSAPQVEGGKLISALREAYPNLDSISGAYQSVLAIVDGCRTDYRQKQTQLLSLLNHYDDWRLTSWTVRNLGAGYPSNNLVAANGTDRSIKGVKALDKMRAIITVQEAADSYQSGHTTAPTLFPATTAVTPTTGG